jgi:hypothetical protein
MFFIAVLAVSIFFRNLEGFSFRVEATTAIFPKIIALISAPTSRITEIKTN